MTTMITNNSNRSLLAGFALALALTSGTCVQPLHASLSQSVEVTETLMHAQLADLVFLGNAFGENTLADLDYTYFVDENSRTFGYTLDSGQTMNGSAISLTNTGYYDEFLGKYLWTQTGSLGFDSWTGLGEAAWDEQSGFGGGTGSISGNMRLSNNSTIRDVNFQGTVSQIGNSYTSAGQMRFRRNLGSSGTPGPWSPWMNCLDWGDATGANFHTTNDGGRTFTSENTGTWTGTATITSGTPTPGPLSLLAIASLIGKRRRQRKE